MLILIVKFDYGGIGRETGLQGDSAMNKDKLSANPSVLTELFMKEKPAATEQRNEEMPTVNKLSAKSLG